MMGSTPTRAGSSSSIGAARIFCSASSESWPFGSRANSERSSGGGGCGGWAIASGAAAMRADDILRAAPHAVAATARATATAR